MIHLMLAWLCGRAGLVGVVINGLPNQMGGSHLLLAPRAVLWGQHAFGPAPHPERQVRSIPESFTWLLETGMWAARAHHCGIGSRVSPWSQGKCARNVLGYRVSPCSQGKCARHKGN